MSGIYKGLAAQISSSEPRAIYIHCYAHCLNLAIKDSVQGVLQVRNTMGPIHELAVVVKASPKRLVLPFYYWMQLLFIIRAHCFQAVNISATL